MISEDLDIFFDTDEFAEAVTHTRGTVDTSITAIVTRPVERGVGTGKIEVQISETDLQILDAITTSIDSWFVVALLWSDGSVQSAETMRGELQDLIVKTTTKVSDGGGSYTYTPTDFYPCRGAVIPLRGKEYFQSDQIQGETTHRVIIPYYAGITTAMTVSMGSRSFEILSAINPVERDEAIEMLCKEIL
jgi:SPP1 family predicted phage head-tail adaptor